MHRRPLKLKKLNCWEFMKCGREPGGSNVNESESCPAATQSHVNGINDGVNGGRLCWAIAGTFCGSDVPGSFAKAYTMCIHCNFYQMVCEEEIGHRRKMGSVRL